MKKSYRIFFQGQCIAEYKTLRWALKKIKSLVLSRSIPFDCFTNVLCLKSFLDTTYSVSSLFGSFSNLQNY